MLCKQEIFYKDDFVEVEYPAMQLGYYAQDDLDLDDAGIWVEYCDHDGETKFMYNCLTEERVYV